MATGNLILQCRAEYSQNKLPIDAAFEDDSVTINVVSSAGSSTAAYSTDKYFDGVQSIMSYNDSIATPLVFNLGTALQHTIAQGGTYIFSLKLMQTQNPLQYAPQQFKVKISIGGVFSGNEMLITLPVTDPDTDEVNLEKDVWYTFAQRFVFTAGQVINFQFEHIVEPTTVGGESTFYIDALKLELDDRLLGIPSVYTQPFI